MFAIFKLRIRNFVRSFSAQFWHQCAISLDKKYHLFINALATNNSH
ncbi:hypothetical protein PROVRETT_08822 [Providencia rettgeri DSM 1131]|nr:hypothetical protein PROVRETT_08822 [Providencia rettgeri DSM 1131]